MSASGSETGADLGTLAAALVGRALASPRIYQDLVLAAMVARLYEAAVIGGSWDPSLDAAAFALAPSDHPSWDDGVMNAAMALVRKAWHGKELDVGKIVYTACRGHRFLGGPPLPAGSHPMHPALQALDRRNLYVHFGI